MSKALFEKEFTTHSIRRSAARWAARCGADDSTIKRAGRWYVTCKLKKPMFKLTCTQVKKPFCFFFYAAKSAVYHEIHEMTK